MDERYKTVLSYGEDEFIVKKSRFIGYVKPISNEKEALEFIEKIQAKHRDATHNVYAYITGQNANTQRFSDDGEPSGTAGVPALEVIKKEGLKDVVVVVTRYFGGVKLGGGGLIRAYTKGAKIGLEAARIVDMVLHRQVKFEVDYDQYGRIENFLMNDGLLTNDVKFTDKVTIYIYIALSQLERFKNEITNLTNGDAEIDELDDLYLPMLKEKRLS
ncbi:MAG TPA: YigZ family protein [Tissierellaceae bacterium]|nr:YigZ family protein [Tissierellaceae bacterium]